MLKMTQDSTDKLEMFNWLVNSVIDYGVEAERAIIYCKSIGDCAVIFRHFLSELGDDAFVSNVPHTVHSRFVAMYHHSTLDRIKEHVLESLFDPAGTVRVVIATTALSMGVNFPNVKFVLQFGPPSDIEEYLQQIGRAGRYGSAAQAVMHWAPRQKLHTDQGVKDIAKGDDCIREAVLQHFQTEKLQQHHPMHDCCNICAASCACKQPCTAMQDIHTSVCELKKKEAIRSRIVSEDEMNVLKQALEEAKEVFVT
jgi:ATP-dependent DNA helicase RecQ